MENQNLTEEEAIDLATKPHLIADSKTCNLVIGFLNGHIADLDHAEWELKLAANQHKVDLLHQKDKTVALKEAEWPVSEQYIKWQEALKMLRKFRAYRYELRDKEKILMEKEKFRPRQDYNFNRVE